MRKGESKMTKCKLTKATVYRSKDICSVSKEKKMDGKEQNDEND